MTSSRELGLPVGSQVVLRSPARDLAGAPVQRSAAGRVVGDDGSRYRVQLPDGRLLLCARGEVELRRRWQAQVGLPAPALDGHELVRQRSVYAAVVGSRAFGLDVDGSDVDVRGTYAAPPAAFFSLVKPPVHVEGPGPEQSSWELERFCELALKANPNLLEVLHSPQVLRCTDLGSELLELRPAFLSRLAHTTYAGCVLSQAKKLQADVRRQGEPRWKHVMHLLRLLLAVRDLLRTGALPLDVGEHRERLLQVRRGELPWEHAERWRAQPQAEVDLALPRSPLPEAPDVAAVDDWLVSVRRRQL